MSDTKWALRARLSAESSMEFIPGGSRVTEDEITEILSSQAAHHGNVLDEEVAIWGAAHPNVPLWWVDRVLNGEVPLEGASSAVNVREALAGNAALPGDVLMKAWAVSRDGGDGLEWIFAAHESLPEEGLREVTDIVVSSGDWVTYGPVFYTLTRNPSLPADCGKALIDAAFAMLDSGDSDYVESIEGFITRSYGEERSPEWFDFESRSRVVVLAATS